jgi:hypothetical protein
MIAAVDSDDAGDTLPFYPRIIFPLECDPQMAKFQSFRKLLEF